MFSQYEPVKTPETADVLHHMEVFHCDSADPDEAFPLWSGPCGDPSAPEKLSRCKKVLAAWAIGAGPFTYPEEAGLAVGGPGFNPHVMLEVHYNNEGKRAGMVDHSGMRFTLTDELRAYDAGILELGLTYVDTMAIPPGVEEFPLSGSCLGQCTNQVIGCATMFENSGFDATVVQLFFAYTQVYEIHRHMVQDRIISL